MKVGIAQIDCELGEVATNMRTITAMMERAAGEGCDLVVFPEMADTGYEIDVIRRCASAWDAGPYRALSKVARDVGLNVICGLSERVDDRIYNAAVVIDRTGDLVQRYRKTHLFSMIDEDQHLARGDALALVAIEGFKIGLMICYDLRFPEMARALALDGADVLVVIAAWPRPRIEHWKLLTEARAVENQVFVVAVNRVGTDGPTTFGGWSRLLDPSGTAPDSAPPSEATLLLGEIDRRRLEEVRASMSVFEDRRADLYGRPPSTC